jgi:ribonucleoside-diphosphate reductase beta chain
MSIFSTNKVDFLNQPIFFGADPNIVRLDEPKYPIFEKLTTQQMSFFWISDEIDLNKDAKDFKKLSEQEQFIFITNIKFQILLDSTQSRSILISLLPHISLPAVECCIIAAGFFESIHNRSYTHIIRNIFANPSEQFNTILDDPMIIERAKSVTKAYDDFIEYSSYYKLLGYGEHKIISNNVETIININEYDLKYKLYINLVAIYILEGIRFYVSFACSFSFSELGTMEGNAKIISLISRDEAIHLAIIQNIIKILPKEDPLYLQIIEDSRETIIEMFKEVATQEKQWSGYLFKGGSVIGLNDVLLSQYVEYMTNKRMKTIGYKPIFPNTTNPLSWTEKYLSSKGSQPAPQETEILSYMVGSVDTNMDSGLFSGFKL